MSLATIAGYNELRKALEFVGKWEWANRDDGGYTNDPDDPGGETKFGIAKRYHPNVDIKNLTIEGAATILANEYWLAAGCSGIPFPDSTAVFDTAINCGVSRAVRWMKESTTLKEFLDKRWAFYDEKVKETPTKRKYLNGWRNRITDLKKYIEINGGSKLNV